MKWNTDLSKVRVHIGTEADGLSKKLNAKAFTTGSDVFFRSGTWNPTSLEGLQLVAHEAWHTVQQAQGLVQKGIDKNQSLEVEARGKGGELSTRDVQSVVKGGKQKTKSVSNAITKTTSAATTITRALQRQPEGSTPKPSSSDDAVWVPVNAKIDTPKELMIELLVKLGYDRALAERHTNQNGVFTYGDETRRWVSWRKPTAQEIKAGKLAINISAEEQSQTKQTASATNAQFRAIHSTARGIRRQGAAQTDVKTVAEVGKIGIVFNPDGVNLYAKPNTSGKDTPLQRVAFNTKVMVVRELEGGWYQVSLPGGNTGYVNKTFLRIYPNDPGANLHQVNAGQSALGVVEQYYRRFAQPGMDLRYFVNVLAHVNPNALKKPDSGNWKDVAFNATTVVYVPGVEFALSLRDKVNDGSLTNGMYSSITNSLGRVGDIVKSVLESPTHFGEVLGDLWEVIKPKLPEFIAITAALIAAEMAVSALAAAPEPTMVTKVVAMLLQGAILLFAGYGAAMSLYSALTEGATWIKAAWNANGNPTQIKLASKAFLRMVGSIALAVLAIMGFRGSLGRFRSLYTKYKTKLPIVEEPAPITSRPTNTEQPQQPGLETRGNRPQPGERAQTREQYNTDPANPQSSMGRLTRLLGEDTMQRIGGKLSQAEIEAFIRELGVAGTKQVVSKFGPEAMMEYGAAFFKNFKGVTNNTIRHLIQNDGISGGEIKGCHDKATFLNELTSNSLVTTSGAPHPLGRIVSTQNHPMNSSVIRYGYKFFQRNSARQVIEPPALSSSANTPTKTVIDGLASNQGRWESVGQLAIIRAIRLRQLNITTAKFSAEAFGLRIEGYLRNGEVHTFYIVW